MKTRTKTAAISALKWAAGLTAGFIIGHTVVILANGQGDPGEMIAEKLVVGIAWFPILFLGLWAWGTFSKKDPLVSNSSPDNQAVESAITNKNSHDRCKNKKPSKWNYISICAGILMLLFIFLPDMINGTLAGQYNIGGLFGIIVIIYCTRNILQARK